MTLSRYTVFHSTNLQRNASIKNERVNLLYIRVNILLVGVISPRLMCSGAGVGGGLYGNPGTVE